MRITHLFFLAALYSLFILALGCNSDEPVLPKSTADSELLILHNQYRALVGVAGLEWSDDLAKKARALLTTDSCVTLMNTEGLGQNNYSVVHSVPGETTPEQVIAIWVTDKYIYELDSCAKPVLGGYDVDLCGAYKQVIWADTKYLGCANIRCFPNLEAWICLYDPAGSVPGERPY